MDKIIFEISNRIEKIPNELEERLLEPFVKFKNFPNLEEEVSSSGLGLYLAKVMAEENSWILNYFIEKNFIIFRLII
jgi:signal transduction histidine kinase